LKTSTVASISNLVRSQVHHTGRPALFATRLSWCSVSRGFVSDSFTLTIRTTWINKVSDFEHIRELIYT